MRIRVILFLLLCTNFGSIEGRTQNRKRTPPENLSEFQQQEPENLKNGKRLGRKNSVVDENAQDIQSAGSRNAATDDEAHGPSLPYNFKYDIKEKETEFSQKVASDGEVVKGEYRVLLPDGRTQIVRYTADWKNGYNPKISYEGTARPYVPPPRRQNRPGSENERDIQAGGSLPLKPKPCPPGYYRLSSITFRPGDSECRPYGSKVTPRPNEQESQAQPGGFRPQPSKNIDQCPPKFTKSPFNGRCVPLDEDEEDIQAGGHFPPKAQESQAQPGGFPPQPSKNQCPPKFTMSPSNGRCVPLDENEEDIQPGGYFPDPTPSRPCSKKGAYGQCFPGEYEQDIQPVGFSPTPKPCPLGYMRYPGKGYGNCQPIYSTLKPSTRETRAPLPSQSIPKPNEHEDINLPAEFEPTTPRHCPIGYILTANGECLQRPGPRVPDAKAQCLAQNRANPKICYPELCYPGSRHPECLKIPGIPAKTRPVDESEEDIQAAGAPPPTQPVRLNAGDAKANCLAQHKSNPKICYPELCYPGSNHPTCSKPVPVKKPYPAVDETEEDIQAAGTPPPTQPARLNAGDAKANCLALHKSNPKICYPELCYPGSNHPRCAKLAPPSKNPYPAVDDNEEDIQAAGALPSQPPQKPSNLYDAPDQPFSVRVNKKFGYY